MGSLRVNSTLICTQRSRNEAINHPGARQKYNTLYLAATNDECLTRSAADTDGLIYMIGIMATQFEIFR